MIRWLMRRKRMSFDEAVPAFDPIRLLSGRLADPVLPPMLIQLPAASLRFGPNHGRQPSNPHPQNRLALKKSQQNQVWVNQVS
jgi:hypothetical protein